MKAFVYLVAGDVVDDGAHGRPPSSTVPSLTRQRSKLVSAVEVGTGNGALMVHPQQSVNTCVRGYVQCMD